MYTFVLLLLLLLSLSPMSSSQFVSVQPFIFPFITGLCALLLSLSLTLARFFILTLYLSLSPSGLTMSSPIRIQGSWILEYRTSLTLIFHLFCSGKKLHFCLLAQWIEQRNNRIQKILSLSLSTFLYWTSNQMKLRREQEKNLHKHLKLQCMC